MTPDADDERWPDMETFRALSFLIAYGRRRWTGEDQESARYSALNEASDMTRAFYARPTTPVAGPGEGP